MTHDDLKRLVLLGEGPRLEFKNRVPRPERIAREVIAFANTDGGTVLIGVDDDGTILGLRDAEEELFALSNALRGRVSPEPEVEIEAVRVGARRDVLVVRVPASAHRPHVLVPEPGTVGEAARQHAYVRVADQSVEASRESIRVMRAEHRGEAVAFTFGEPERRLLEYLDRHERITVAEYARMAEMPPWRASKTLVALVRAGIVQLHPRPGGDDHFTAAG
ncbi:MAG TPA: RNA-binding domain-containing protein [Rubricoccaceae bacterium]|jgi:predicted HTH transcriptional regulator